MILYHYRPMDSGLDEIKNHTIRFSSRENLNDPIEGYISLIWQGDKPAWEGLLRNYFCSFYDSILHLMQSGSNVNISDVNVIGDVNTEKNEIRRMAEQFLADNDIQAILNALSCYSVECEREELKAILSALTEKIIKMFVELGYYSGIDLSKVLRPSKIDVHQIAVGVARMFSPDRIKILFQSYAALAYGTGIMLFKQVNQDTVSTEEEKDIFKNFLRLRYNFNETYVDELYEMVYPRGFVTCFSETPDNTVMWGNYADGHKGVCLRYEIDEEAVQSVFEENKSYQISDNIFGVQYVNGSQHIVKRNFFNDIWYCAEHNTAETWLTGLNGVMSSIRYDTDIGHQYNALFEQAYGQKMPEWGYEKEHRILLRGNGIGRQDAFVDIPIAKNCLKAVIFGISTPLKVKAEYEAAIENGGYSDVEFEQAVFHDDTQRIGLMHIIKDQEDFENNGHKIVEEIAKALMRF